MIYTVLITLLCLYVAFIGLYFVRNSVVRGNFNVLNRIMVISLYLPVVILPVIVLVGLF